MRPEEGAPRAPALAGLVALAALLAPPPALPGQEAGTEWRLVPGPDLLVSRDEPELAHVEPHLAVNPRDGTHLVAASIVFRDGRMTSETLLSLDGGGSWIRTPFPDCAGDPWVTWGSGQNVYFSCLGAGDAPVRALVHRSEDGGRSWSEGVEIPWGGGSSFDHTSMAVLPRPDSADVIHLGGMQGLRAEDRPPISAPFTAVSRDGGRSFEHSGRIVWSDVMSNALNPVVLGPEGVGLPFVDFSVDGRSRIDHPRIWWVRSRDGGRDFTVPHLVTGAAETGTLPVMASGPPGADSPSLFLAYDDARDGEQGIFLTRSRDGGGAWSEPLRVAAGDGEEVEHQNPVTATDPAGTVGIAWYERPPGRREGCWRVRFTASVDGGKAFLPPATLSSREFCPRPDGVAGADRWRAGGDYFGLIGYEDGAFRVLWADSRSGVYQLRTTTVRLQKRSPPAGPPASAGRPGAPR